MKKPATYHELLDDALRKHVPDDVTLLPHLATQYAKGKSSMRIRSKISLSVALALIVFAVVLFTLPGAAFALQRLLAYLPGVGVVDQSTMPRKLAQPVSQTRGGITVTVKSANVSTEITAIYLDLGEIPTSAYPPASAPPEDSARLCSPNVLYLRYPDGTRGELNSQGFIGLSEPAYWNWYFAPVPASFDTAVLVMPCVPGTNPGTVPEDWEFPLHFVPAVAGDFAPVVFPTPQPTQAAASPTPTPPGPVSRPSMPRKEDIVLVLDKIVRLPDGDAFYAHISAAEDAPFAVDVGDERLTDINGQPLAMLAAPDDPSAFLTPSRPYLMSFKTDGPVHAPVMITVDDVRVDIVAPGRFSFNAGPHPKVGQQWKIEEDIEVGGRVFRVTSASLAADGYHFVIETDSPDVFALSIFTVKDGEIQEFFSSADDDPLGGPFHITVGYQGEPPSGVVSLQFYVTLKISGPWQVTWQP